MRRALAFLAILVVAGACALGEVLADYGDPVDLRPADLVGTWQSGHRRAIVFREDGTFAATDLPYGVFDEFLPDGFDPARDRIDGSGTWTLKPPAKEGRSTAVKMSFGELAGETSSLGGVHLTALQNDGVVALFFFYVDDGGNSWTAYRKCAPDCT